MEEIDFGNLTDQRVMALYANTGVPRYAQGRRVEDFREHAPDAYHQAKEFIKRFPLRTSASPERSQTGRGLLLTGEHGSGVTSLACAVVTDICLAYGAYMGYVSFYDWARTLGKQRQDMDATEQAIGRRVRLNNLLIIDDIGGSRALSGFVIEETMRLLRDRESRGFPVILVTHLTPQHWTKHLGECAQHVKSRFDRIGI